MKASSNPQRKVRSQSDLAQHLGLSDWTVSRAINGHPAVKEATRQRVLEAMKEIGFQPNPLARGLRGKGTGLVGISFNELGNAVLLEKLASFEDFLHRHNLRSILSFTELDEAIELRAIADFRRLQVDAIMLVQSTLPPAKSAKALAGFRGVHVDPVTPQSSLQVRVDRNRGVELLIDHLAALGHRSFGTLGIHESNSWRWPGLLRALKKHGLDPAESLKQYVTEMNGVASFALGIQAAELVLADPAPPTALLALNDRVALAAAQHLEARGASVPGRFSITGFDHLEIAAYLHPTVTTIDHEPQKLMETAGHLLISQLRGEFPAREEASHTIEPRLIVGESTGPAFPG